MPTYEYLVTKKRNPYTNFVSYDLLFTAHKIFLDMNLKRSSYTFAEWI